MKEADNSPQEIPPEDSRSRYFREHPFAGQPLLRRVRAWREYAGLETQPKVGPREPQPLKSAA